MPSSTKSSTQHATPSRQATPQTKNLSGRPSEFDSDESLSEGGSDQQVHEKDSTTTVSTKHKAQRPRIAFAADTVGGNEFQDYRGGKQEGEDDTRNGPPNGGDRDMESNGVSNSTKHSNTADKKTPVSSNGTRQEHQQQRQHQQQGKSNRQRRRRHHVHNSSSTADQFHSGATEQTTDPTLSQWKRRKRGRVARMVHVTTTTTPSQTPSLRPATTTNFPPLPGNQYSTILKRRAIRKLEDKPETTNHNDIDDEEYGDISLGMKLIVAGGKVIVQSLNALTDGRASPAQLTGVIQRGDVLMAVGDVSLASLPIDQLMTGLKPLSSPETADGKYRRVLRLRLEAGAGDELLKSHEKGLTAPTAATTEGQAAVNDMFALFPMVDQLSGAPLVFEQASFDKDDDNEPKGSEELDEDEERGKTPIPSPSTSRDDATALVEQTTPDELISTLLAKQRQLDRERFASEFFNWKEGFSELLRADISTDEYQEQQAIGTGLTKSERIDLGLQVMKLAKTLTYGMEDLDKGKDIRSFKTWSTNFSLRSGASTRRRHVMDAASLRSHRPQDDGIDDSVGSPGSESFGSVDGDALLLGLAAHDDIWRKQVLDALQEAIEKMEKGEPFEDDKQEEETQENQPNDINFALQDQFGAILFGENMNKIIKKKKKSYALPPEDITTVLFDLTTHIATAAPDEVTVLGGTANSFSYQSSFGTQGRARTQLRADILLANRFILDEVLPLWLEAFRPLGLEQRRLFWPKLQRGSAGSYGGANTHGGSDNDSLTVDSNGSAPKGNTSRTSKNLQEMIEDTELDVETRAETCYLVTYYFTRQVLAKYTTCMSGVDTQSIDEEVASFVQKYGTYLQIHSCLAFSASVQADRAIDELLEVAKHDPSHRDAVNEIEKANDLTFYDVSKLTAVLEFLLHIRYEKPQRRKVIKNLCVAAYPDARPWQVKKSCFDPALSDDSRKSCSEDTLREFYYSYLSQLLDPVEGQDAARHCTELVKEWCEWSIGLNGGSDDPKKRKDKLQNFYRVASRTSSAHLAYRRDLPTLLEMSMRIKEYNLALELTTEIIEDRKLCNRAKTVHRVLVCLREIGLEGLALAWDSREEGSKFHTLKRVLRAFHQMSHSDFRSCRESIDVPDELLTLLEDWYRKIDSANFVPEILILVDFMIHESAPIDVLCALVLWSKSDELGPALFSRLDSLLRRGVQVALKSELSGSLLRLKYMRRGYTEENKPLMISKDRKGGEKEKDGIWKRMSLGALTMDK